MQRELLSHKKRSGGERQEARLGKEIAQEEKGARRT